MDWFPALTAIAVVGTALYAKHYHQGISAKRATVDFITRSESGNPTFIEARRVFGEISNKGPEALKSLKKNPDNTKLATVTMYLNHYEVVAIAVGSGALDEDMYKMWNRTVYVQTWKRAHEYIVDARNRKNHPTLLEHFEALAKRWDS